MNASPDLLAFREPDCRAQISIILPFLNPGTDFKLAVQSVFAQTFKDWELLLIDDGSTDGSLEFARNIYDSRVRVFSDGFSIGLSRRLNELIDLANAPYIARMDADDVMHPDRLQEQYNLLTRHDNRTVIGTGTYSIDVHSRITGVRLVPNHQHYGYAATRSFVHGTVAASAEWFRQYRYSTSFIFVRSEDAELWFRSSAESRFINIEKPLFFYREVGNFSLEKYVASTLAMIMVGSRLASQSRIRCFYAITVTMAKLWVVIAAVLSGNVNRIIARRSQPIPPREIAAAQQVLARIQEIPLPTFGSRDHFLPAIWPMSAHVLPSSEVTK